MLNSQIFPCNPRIIITLQIISTVDCKEIVNLYIYNIFAFNVHSQSNKQLPHNQVYETGQVRSLQFEIKTKK